MNREKQFAYCGLACCICSLNENCPGCRNEGCNDKEGCKSFSCCREKGLKGCWECDQYPCDNKMLKSLRHRAFTRFICEFGEDKLMEALEANERLGIKYHYEGKLIGDYDLDSENRIVELIFKGLGWEYVSN